LFAILIHLYIDSIVQALFGYNIIQLYKAKGTEQNIQHTTYTLNCENRVTPDIILHNV